MKGNDMRTKEEYQKSLNEWYAIYIYDLEEKKLAKESYFTLQELIDNLKENDDR